jgi:hypothetical protein
MTRTRSETGSRIHSVRTGPYPGLLRRLAIPAVAGLVLAFGLLPAPPAEAQFGKNKVQYREFDWKIYRSPHFDVYYYTESDELLEKVVSFAESAYDHLSRRLDYRIDQSTPLIFYENHAEFEQNNIILGFIPEAVGAFATSVRFRMVLPVDMPDNELYELLLHELVHIFQYHILFGARSSAGAFNQPPTWLIEGMASYYAQDESTSDKMFLRDAVVNDLVPPITQARGGGFFAYRFGHAVFEYMEERWGPEGVLDFLYEYRGTLGANVDRALKRAFRVEAEDFDIDFRRWLRDKYLPELVATGEPSYFGRRFFGQNGGSESFFAPAASPSGDLLAAYSTARGRLDVVLLDTRERRPLRNLTRGWSTDYQYFSAQFATSVRRMGSDLAFSPDGNTIAAFARREGGRSLVLVDVVRGGIRRIIDLEVQQPFGPAFSPDGRRVAFSASTAGRFDIYTLDLESGEVTNLTDDRWFNGAPVFSPDGRYLVYSAVIGEHAKLFRLDLEDPSSLQQLTRGEHNDLDPSFNRDGSRLYFTSDRNGFDNIYELDLTSGQIYQHTNVVTGAMMPTVLERADGSRNLVYMGYWRGRFDLYRGELEALETVESVSDLLAQEPGATNDLRPFQPDIQVAIHDDNKERYRGFRLFLDDADVGVGVTSDQLIVSQTFLSFSDYLGDKRVFLRFDSISSFSDFSAAYVDLSSRLQWGVELYDQRTFFLGVEQLDPFDPLTRVRRQQVFRQTGARGFLSYPLSFYHRVEGSLGYVYRDYFVQRFFEDPGTGFVIPFVAPQKDHYPEAQLFAVGDTAVFAPWGPISGRRWRVGGSYAPDLSAGGTLTSSALVDFRQYVPLTRRMNLAFRTFGGASFGDTPNVFFFGGLDTVRGFRFRELVGDRAFYSNLELRFPLIDALALPFLRFDGIRGRVFVDMGGAWFDYAGQSFTFWDSDENRLGDAVASYGWGFTVRFLGLDLHWDFAKRWDFRDTLDDGFETSFWIGPRF